LAFVLAASVPFLVVFAGCIATSIGPPDPARRLLWDRVLIGGAVLTGAMALVVAIVHLSLADGANHGVSALFIPFADFFALLLTGVWIIATSVTLFLFRERGEPGYAGAPRIA
jgi:hypothetical protein